MIFKFYFPFQTQKSTDKGKADDYDVMVRELMFEKKGLATDRLKTEDENAKAEMVCTMEEHMSVLFDVLSLYVLCATNKNVHCATKQEFTSCCNTMYTTYYTCIVQQLNV